MYLLFLKFIINIILSLIIQINNNSQKTEDLNESLIVRQNEYKKSKLNRRRTGKSKEYLNTLLSRGCPTGQKKCSCCKKYDTNRRKKTRTDLRLWCKVVQDSPSLVGGNFWKWNQGYSFLKLYNKNLFLIVFL